MKVYPNPRYVREAPGCFCFGAGITLEVASGAMDLSRRDIFAQIARQFCFTGCEWTIEERPGLAPYSAKLGAGREIELAPGDSYALSVTPEGAYFIGADARGLIYAMWTLLQRVRPVCLERGEERFCLGACDIRDRPAVGVRAVHMCVFPETTLLTLEKAIRLAAALKLTHIVLEFWGAVRLETCPELAWPERSFAKSEIRPLVALANSLGLEVIPMFNHLGHASQCRGRPGRHAVLDQAPRKALLFEPDGWTWCVSNPATISLMRGVREELTELCGEGEYFHLGCDEAHSFATCPICSEREPHELFAAFVNGVAGELKRAGRRGVIWGDLLLNKSEWSAPYEANSRPDMPTHMALDKLDTSLVIADWQYAVTHPGMPTSEMFSRHGFDVWACSWDARAGNHAAIAAAADKQRLAGVCVTTWHHLNEMLRTIQAWGSSAWLGEAYAQDKARSVPGALLRKVTPPALTFERAGFLPAETDIHSVRVIG